MDELVETTTDFLDPSGEVAEKRTDVSLRGTVARCIDDLQPLLDHVESPTVDDLDRLHLGDQPQQSADRDLQLCDDAVRVEVVEVAAQLVPLVSDLAQLLVRLLSVAHDDTVSTPAAGHIGRTPEFPGQTAG